MLIAPTKVTAPKYVPSYSPPVFNGLAFVAQSPGQKEELTGVPLVGASGQLLEECAQRAGIDFTTCWRGNVVGYRPDGNNFSNFCAKKKEVGGKDYTLPPIRAGQYLKPEYLPELRRLAKELEELRPNLVVALGNEALWALCGLSGIGKYRGAIIESTLVPGLKVLPTFHPANIFRVYENRIYLQLDLFKAKGEAAFPDIRTIPREISIYPESPAELWSWDIKHRTGEPDTCLLSVDIEDKTTKGSKIIECIGFAFDKRNALVVPFWSDLRSGHNYWQDLEDELEAWNFVDYMLRIYPILGQNFCAYDTWVLAKEMGIVPGKISHDTMVLHHAHQPEMRKGLGLLSSLYCNVPATKQIRPRGKHTEKRDE